MSFASIFLVEFKISVVQLNVTLLEERKESNQVEHNSESGNAPSNGLPSRSISLVWFIDVIL